MLLIQAVVFTDELGQVLRRKTNTITFFSWIRRGRMWSKPYVSVGSATVMASISTFHAQSARYY